MTITTITVTNRRGLAAVESAVTRCPATQGTHFLAAAQGSINADLSQGCAAGQTITGPARIPTGGKAVQPASRTDVHAARLRQPDRA